MLPFTKEEKATIKKELSYDLSIAKISENDEYIEIDLGQYYFWFEKTMKGGKKLYECTAILCDFENELLTPEALMQCYKYYPDLKELLFEAPRDIVEACKKKCRRELAIGKYVGTLDECLTECLFEKHELPRIKQNIESKMKIVESSPKMRIRENSTEITVSPAICEKKCYINIPHYHLFLGFNILIRSEDLHELIRYANNIHLLIEKYEKQYPEVIRKLYEE